MAKYLILVFVACIVNLSTAKSVSFQDCGSKKGKIESVDITPCEEEPCTLKKGTTVHVKITFEPHEDVPAATSVVHGIIEGIPIPFPLPNPDACKASHLTCPLKSGSTYTFYSELAIKSIYPSIELLVKWEMKDKQGADVFCWEIPTKIVS